MSRKRKSEETGLDDADRSLYSNFCGAANSLSQLYTQAMNLQKLSFQAGEGHALGKLYQWILRQHEEGSRVTTADIVSHIQNKIGDEGDEAIQHQHVNLGGIQTSSSPYGHVNVGFAPRTCVLPVPAHICLQQSYELSQGANDSSMGIHPDNPPR